MAQTGYDDDFLVLASNHVEPADVQTEFLTGCFSGKPSHCARQLWNFAFAGADISKDLFVSRHLSHNFAN